MHEKQLTIIIPFLNEKDEIEKTVESILEHSNDNVNIIVINDASDDGYDYQSLPNKYPIQYIENSQRKGVAASRDMGVELCATPYFLLLDAHMRFYDTDWVGTIINLLRENSKYLLCCQTKSLRKNKDNVVHESETRRESFGSAVDLFDSHFCFSPRWVFKREDINNDDQIIDIPCILGAGYACSKEYWQYLRGLDGLLYYGFDETYISIKVWLSGGRCKLLRNTVIGHIYRDAPPYYTDNYFLWYNRLLINALLVPAEQQKVHLSKMRKGNFFAQAYRLFRKNDREIAELRKYYDTILTEDFSYFEELNEKFGSFTDAIENEDEFLNKLAPYLLLRCQSIEEIGLLHGRMGIIIFIYHYSKYVGCKVYEALAGELLETLCSSLNLNMSYFLQSGLAGIGWGIEYLHQNGFVEGDIDDVLEVIDDKIKEVDISKVKDLTINSGLGGIVHYVIARLYNKDISEQKIFEQEYLHVLYKRLVGIVEGEEAIDSIEVFVKYINLYERKVDHTPLSIYDIFLLYIPKDYDMEKSALGIYNGNSGVGLKLIFEKGKNKQYTNK